MEISSLQKRPQWFVLLAALIAVLPLIHRESYCGMDFKFHLQSWIDAASQFRHGTIYPRWTFAAAYNSGEPRFIFYPPFTWVLGGLLTLVLPIKIVPVAITWLTFSIAGLTMHRLLKPYVSPQAALLGACVYLANPFMISSTVGRAAYGEMLAAAFCPLLIAAMLSDTPTVWRVGAPLTLMWLSNVPGGVIGTYLLVSMALLQLGRRAWRDRNGGTYRSVVRLTLIYSGGLAFGLGLASFYLVPAMVQRRYILMSEAYQPGYRVTDNLLLHRVLDPVRDMFLLSTAHIALAMAAVIACTLLLLFSLRNTPSEAMTRNQKKLLTFSVILSALALFLLTYMSAPAWRHLPAIWVLQFPWRLLFIVSACMTMFVALLFRNVRSSTVWIALSLAITAVLAIPETRELRYPCGPDNCTAQQIQEMLARHHSPKPADEYVLADADAGAMRPDNPPYWTTNNPQSYAPGTTENRTPFDPEANMPVAPADAKLMATPLAFSVTAPHPGFLVINLGNFHNWIVMANGTPSERLQRADGLIVFAIPAGVSNITIHWHHTWDEWVGACITSVAAATWLASKLLEKSSLIARAT